MNEDLTLEEKNRLKQILLQKYDGFTKEEQERIKALGQGVAFDKFYNYAMDLEYDLDIEIVTNEFLGPIIGIIYSNKDIIDGLKKMKWAADIPAVLEIKKKLGIEDDYTIPYSDLIEYTIETNDYREFSKLYFTAYDTLDDETKMEAIKFFLQKQEYIYISSESIDSFIDIIKFTKKIGVDNSIFVKKIASDPSGIVEFCLKADDELIDDLSKQVKEENKVLLNYLLTLKKTEEITEEQLKQIYDSLPNHNLELFIANYAIKKGYTPNMTEFKKGIYSSNESIVVLSNKNLCYYLLAKKKDTLLDEKINNVLDSKIKKQAFSFFKHYRNTSLFWDADSTIYELEDMLKEENLYKYFDENGCKKEFLIDVIEKFNNIDNSYSNKSFVYFCFDELKDKLSPDELKYYDFLITTLRTLENKKNSCTASVLKRITTNKEDFYNIINDDEKIKEIINDSNKDINTIIGLLKINAISDQLKDELFDEREKISLQMIEEIITKNPNWKNEIEIIQSIYNNSDYFDEFGQIKGNFYQSLIKKQCLDSLLSLDNRYVSADQKKFISIVAPIIKELSINQKENQLRFICDTFSSKETIEKYIIDNKPTKSLIDKLFEEGCLNCIENIEDYEKYLNDKQKLIFSVYKNIKDRELKSVYEDFISGSIEAVYSGNIKESVINNIPELLTKIRLSNSREIAGRYINIATMILQNTNENSPEPIEQFAEIEKIFLTKNLSHMDKIFKSFQLLYPHDKLIKTIIEKKETISPMLLKYATAEDTVLGREAEKIYGDKTYAVEMLMYADLIKTTIASNDKTFIEYIENIEKGNLIFSELKEGKKNIYNLSSDEKYVLNTYIYHLESLYNRNNPNNNIKLSSNFEDNISMLIDLYKEVDLSKIPDQIIKNNYGCYLGITTIKELKELMIASKKQANEKGVEYAKRPMILEKGDVIKGIGDIDYFDTIIQNGSVSKEFLGGNIGSDLTPFDTDLSIIPIQKETNEESIKELAAKNYGPIFFIIKNAVNKYNCTRSDKKESFELVETQEELAKVEIFQTLGDTHYGIRTGFSTTQVDYICCGDERLIEKIGLVLAKNGFYIPVVNMGGELLFTPEKYENLRKKMNGLSYYGVNSYNFAPNLSNEYTLELVDAISNNIEQTALLRSKLEEKLKTGFANSGLQMKTTIDGDLQSGSVELIDTGSTGRGTNQIGDGDFDYLVRIDRSESYDRKVTIANNVCEELSIDKQSGNLRKAKVRIDDKEVEVDISYALKSDKITYTTDMSLSDRLETIKKQDPEKYLLVLSNIVLAKTLLKKGECYKPYHAGENPQGGLGGVGTENWILQNGGSLEEAAEEFLIASGVMKVVEINGKKEIIIDETSRKEYDEFKMSYSVWDFGQNQLSEERARSFPHDNFVWNNMNSEGYGKMIKVMQTYILELHPEIKFIPSNSKENLNTVETVRNFLQGLKPQNTYQEESNTDKLGK